MLRYEYYNLSNLQLRELPETQMAFRSMLLHMIKISSI